MGKLRGGPGGQDTTRIVGPMILATKKSQNVSEKEENFAIVVQRVSRVRLHTIRAKVFSMQRLSTRTPIGDVRALEGTTNQVEPNDNVLVRVIVISDVHSRSKLVRRLISLCVLLRVCLLVLVASFFSSIPAQASNVSLPTTGRRLDFAIADFDGDGRPNLATIEPGSNSPSQTIYRIQVQLGDGGLRSVDLVAPSGGLRIAADDVNGDGIPDLIISLAWREGPVAVLLNDGHASFSLAESSSFPGVSGGSGKSLNGEELPPQTDTVATPSKLPVGDFPGSKYLLHARQATDSLPRANFARISNLLLVSLLGRAPPTRSCL